MKEPAKNLQEIKSAVDEFKNRTERENGIWFRGVVNSTYDLVPSLQRSLPRRTSHTEIKDIEKKMFEIFKETPELKGHQYTDWELLYLMQHFGVKTRFLDWSYSALVSLFFATYNWDKKQNARIWLLDPYLLNEVYLKESAIVSPKKEKAYFDFLNSFTIDNSIYAFDGYKLNYQGINKRIAAQKGVFTLHLSRNFLSPSIYALNKVLENDIEIDKSSHSPSLRVDFPDATAVLDYIDIDPLAVDEIKKYLLEKGITLNSLFPDLKGTADYINSIFPDF